MKKEKRMSIHIMSAVCAVLLVANGIILFLLYETNESSKQILLQNNKIMKDYEAYIHPTTINQAPTLSEKNTTYQSSKEESSKETTFVASSSDEKTTALPNTSEEAIETENINYLKKFPKIGDKVARQVILDLKGKLNVINTGLFAREDHREELTEALLGLGYKQADVKKIVSKVNSSLPVEEQIKEALKLLLK